MAFVLSTIAVLMVSLETNWETPMKELRQSFIEITYLPPGKSLKEGKN